MTRASQLHREQAFVDAMVKSLPLDLSVPPEQRDPPEPDFILALADGRRIRLEVTEAIDSEIARAWQGKIGRIRDAIEQALVANGLNAFIGFKVELDAAMELARPAVLQRNVERIVTLVREVMPGGCAPDKALLRKHGIEHIRFLYVNPDTRPKVAVSSSSYPPGAEAIQVCIDAKAEKLDGYRQSIGDEYWLLVVGGEPLSGPILDDVQGRTFISPFDRTLFLDRSARVCVALETVPPESE